MLFTVSKVWHLCQFLEWKFIEFSGLFHCLIIKVPGGTFSSTAKSKISLQPTEVWLLLCCSRSDLIRLTHSRFNVKHFFTFFKKIFTNLQHRIVWIVLTFRSFEAALLSYHSVCGLSTTFFNFFEILLLNGEGGIWTLAPLLTTCTLSRGVPSASLGTSPNTLDI